MNYRPAVDLTRLLSAALIVSFHTPTAPWQSITITGLAFFVLLTFCLQAMGAEKGRSFSPRERAHRLLLPWMVWTLIFLIAKLIIHGPFVMASDWKPSSLLVGSEMHLWFLPYAFLGGVAAFFLIKAVQPFSRSVALTVLILLFVALALVFWLVKELLFFPMSQWAYASPLIPLGLAIGFSQQLPRRTMVVHNAVILVSTTAITWICDVPSYLLGVLALCFSMLPRSHDWENLRWFAGLSMGVYLIHPLFFLVLYKFYPNASWSVFASIALMSSVIASGVIMSIPRLSIVMFGANHRPASKSPVSSHVADEAIGPVSAALQR